MEAGLQLTARLLEKLELPDEVVTGRVAAMRAAELGRLGKKAATDAADPETSTERNGEHGNLS